MDNSSRVRYTYHNIKYNQYRQEDCQRSEQIPISHRESYEPHRSRKDEQESIRKHSHSEHNISRRHNYSHPGEKVKVISLDGRDIERNKSRHGDCNDNYDKSRYREDERRSKRDKQHFNKIGSPREHAFKTISEYEWDESGWNGEVINKTNRFVDERCNQPKWADDEDKKPSSTVTTNELSKLNNSRYVPNFQMNLLQESTATSAKYVAEKSNQEELNNIDINHIAQMINGKDIEMEKPALVPIGINEQGPYNLEFKTHTNKNIAGIFDQSHHQSKLSQYNIPQKIGATKEVAEVIMQQWVNPFIELVTLLRKVSDDATLTENQDVPGKRSKNTDRLDDEVKSSKGKQSNHDFAIAKQNVSFETTTTPNVGV